MCLKAWGQIQGSNIKNMWLMCERMRLNLFLFFSFHGFFNFLFSPSRCALGGFDNAFFLTATLWASIKPIMSTLKLVKMRKLVCFHIMSSIHSMSSFSHHLSKKGKRKQWKKLKTKKLTTLDPNIQFGSPNHELSYKHLFCYPDQLVFFSKWCHVN